MKKTILQCALLGVVGILLLFGLLGLIDYRRTVHSFEKPIFARNIQPQKDGGSGRYSGIGYAIDIQGNFMPEDELSGVTHARFYILGQEVDASIRD